MPGIEVIEVTGDEVILEEVSNGLEVVDVLTEEVIVEEQTGFDNELLAAHIASDAAHRTPWKKEGAVIQPVAQGYSLDMRGGDLDVGLINGVAVGRLQWVNYATTWTQKPVKIEDVAGGSVIQYVYGQTTLYRFVPSPYDAEEDAFYREYNLSTLSTLLARRGSGFDSVPVPGGGSSSANANAVTIAYAAGESITINRMVTARDGLLFTADKDNAADAKHVVGLSLQSASIGEPVEVLLLGERIDGSFTYSGDEGLFLGADGRLETTAPTTGVLVRVGAVTSPTSINISIQQPIVLAQE
jgi:hypothetical protein